MIKKVFPILGLAIFSSLLGAGIVAPLLPLYAESLGATGVWLGAIFAAFSISQAISTPIFSRLSDRIDRKLIISIGLLLYTFISLGFVWADSVSHLILVRLLHGAAGGMILPVAQAYIGDVCPEGEEGRWMGYANAAFFTGFGFGPFMGGTLTEQFGMDFAFYSMSGLNLLAFLVVLFFLPGSGHRISALGPHLSFREASASNEVRGLCSFRLTFALGRSVFMVFLPIFAAARLGLSPSLTGILLTIQVLLYSLLGIPSGRLLSDRFNKRLLIIIGTLITVVFMALIPAMDNFWQLLVLVVLGSVGGAIALPAASALTVEEGRKFGMGSVIAIFSIAFSIGMATGPILSGAIRDFVGINAVFYFGAAIVLAGAALYAWFTK